MTHVPKIAEHGFGLCRKPPAVHPLQTRIDIQQESAHENRSSAGGSGSGAIRRGIETVLAGMKTLNRNRQLLWFTLLGGLVLAGNIIGQAAFRYIGWNLHIHLDIIVSYVLDFLLNVVTLFCLVFLLAGLALTIPSKKESAQSVFQGLAGAKKYLIPIFGWSVILALACMLLVHIYVLFPVCRVYSLSFLNIFGYGTFTSTITQFPFNWNLDWNMLTEFPGYGGRSLLLWIYPFGFLDTLLFSVVTLFLFMLTLFVVPIIVLEQKTIREAVVESFVMMKKSWIEVAACAVFLGVVVSGVFLTYLLVQAASGIVSPYETVIHNLPVAWMALAVIYDLALLTCAFVMATVGGIALMDLYTSAKKRQVPGSAGLESLS